MGIQISGLLANSAFDWKSVVDQLIAADSIPITTLQTGKTTNSDQVTALAAVQTSLQDMQDSLQSMRSGDIFTSRNVSSDAANTTWKCSSVTGAAIGSYKFAVTQLATAARVTGKADIGAALVGGTHPNLGSFKLADLVTATAITAGTFTVNGQEITIAPTTDTLQSVFDQISTATGGDVTASYDPKTDGITLKNSNGDPIALGGETDSSNFLSVAKLASNGTETRASSSAWLGTVIPTTSLTLATMRTSTAVTAGTFSINGQQVTIATTDSMQGVFDKISAATGAHVSACYDPSADGIKLTSDNGPVVLGAANDTSNFLAVMKLANNGTATSVSSSAPLGAVATTATLAQSGLTGDFSAGGSFLVNGVTINYTGSDNLGAILSRISQSAAGVTTSYDSATDRVLLANKTTGDVGISASDASGGLLAALGLTAAVGGALVHGKNALFSINGGPTLSSTTNTLDASVHGISGLSVTVNSETTQTLQIDSDTATMQTAIQSFIDKFNATQDLIETDTKINTTGGAVTTSVLSSNREVQGWARQLQSLAFDAVSSATGSVKRLSDLGIDFNGITGHLTIKDSGKLATALGDHPDDVTNFFLNGSTAFVPKLYGYLGGTISADRAQQNTVAKANSDIDAQIATLQSRLNDERANLTNSFMAMLDAQSAAQSQQTYLTNTFFKNYDPNACWVARVVYGANNPLWLVFRHWLLHRAPGWFRALYLRRGERFAGWLADKPWLQCVIRRWMDARIASLVPAFPSH